MEGRTESREQAHGTAASRLILQARYTDNVGDISNLPDSCVDDAPVEVLLWLSSTAKPQVVWDLVMPHVLHHGNGSLSFQRVCRLTRHTRQLSEAGSTLPQVARPQAAGSQTSRNVSPGRAYISSCCKRPTQRAPPSGCQLACSQRLRTLSCSRYGMHFCTFFPSSLPGAFREAQTESVTRI